jgi:uncharacterized membrane protein YkoI
MSGNLAAAPAGKRKIGPHGLFRQLPISEPMPACAMNIIRTLAGPALILLSLAAPVTVGAKDPESKRDEKALKKQAQEEAILAMRRGEILPLTRILEIANRHVAGDIIEVEYKGGPKYEIKILTASGRVREVKLNARTGALLEIEDD